MTYSFTIHAKALGGLAVDVDADADGASAYAFASSGNALPATMVARIEACADDVDAITREVESAYYEDGRGAAYRNAVAFGGYDGTYY